MREYAVSTLSCCCLHVAFDHQAPPPGVTSRAGLSHSNRRCCNARPSLATASPPGIPLGTPVTIPVVAITAVQGAAINDTIAAGAATLTWTNEQSSVPNPTANLISSFSSYGLAPDLSLKPDIGAPGASVSAIAA